MVRRAFLTLVLPTLALAQATKRAVEKIAAMPAIPAVVKPDAGIYGKESTQGVFVRDSTTAVEKFALVERMERMREWPKAADIYQEVLAGAGDRVVPSRVDKQNVIYQYTSVALSVHERLAKWPDDGIAAYRSRYEPAAATLLAGANETGVEDLGTLGRVVTLYFPTDAAKAAAIRLSADYLDTGDFAAAAWLTDRLWQFHPALGTDRPAVLFRSAIAHHLAGNAAAAADRLKLLKADHAGATGKVKGEVVDLAAALEPILHQPSPVAAKLSNDSWPDSFGNAERTLLPPASPPAGAKMFTIDLASTAPRLALPPQVSRELIDELTRSRSAGLATGILPAVDRGELYFQDNARLYAVNLDTGLPLPGWAATYDGAKNGRYTAPGGSAVPIGMPMGVALSDDAVLAVMNQPSGNIFLTASGAMPQGPSQSVVVCLDRTTGVARWTAQPSALPQALRESSFVGVPLVVGDSVFVTCRGGRRMQFDDCYVLCFALANGQLRWSSYVASSNANISQFGEEDGSSPPVAQMSYSSGRLYVLTNIGAIASIDAHGGTILWLNLYPRDLPNVDAFNGRFRNGLRATTNTQDKPWSAGPPIISGGKIFAMPSDASSLYLYDAFTGEETSRINLKDFSKDVPSTLVGVFGERAIVASINQLFCIDWPHYDPKKPADDNVFWRTSVLTRGGSPTDSIRGRPFVAGDLIYVPVAWGLNRFSLKRGVLIDAYPPGPGTAWPAGEVPGNVIAVQDHLVIAGADRIVAYADLGVAMKKLDLAIAAAPNDPLPRLRYADVLFAAGDAAGTLAKFDDSANAAGGLNAALSVDLRGRLFSAALSYARRLNEGKKADSAVVATLFDRAASAARDPAQQVDWRVARASFERDGGRFDKAVVLYQQILADATLRAESVGAVPAALAAERAIAEIISRNGPVTYQPFEQAAVVEFEHTVPANDPKLLIDLAARYPNSSAAARSLFAAAEKFEQADAHAAAAATLRQLTSHYPNDPQKLKYLEAAARNYLASPPRVDVAIGRLTVGVTADKSAVLSADLPFGEGNTLPAGTTFSAAIEKLRETRATLHSPTLPLIGLPVPKAGEPARKIKPFTLVPAAEIKDVAFVLEPAAGFNRPDRIVVWSPGSGLRAFEPGGTQPILHAPMVDRPIKAWWVGNEIAVCTARGVYRIAADRPTWTYDLKPLGAGESPPEEWPEDAVADGDSTSEDVNEGHNVAIQQVRIRGGNVLIANGRVIQANGLNLVNPNGVAPLVGPADGESITTAALAGERLTVGTSAGRVICLDLGTGKPAWSTRPFEQPVAVVANDDQVVAYAAAQAGQHLAAFDASTGAAVYRKAFAESSPLINLALGADGSLVMVTPAGLTIKDLFDPNAKEVASVVRPGAVPFANITRPDQIAIVDRRVMILADQGTFVRGYSLDTAKPLQVGNPGGPTADLMLPVTKSPDEANSSSLFVDGPRLYCTSLTGLACYNLDRPKDTWSKRLEEQWKVRRILFGRDWIISVDQRAVAAGGEAALDQARLIALSRAMAGSDVPPRESGVVGHFITLDKLALNTVHAVNGGLYYRTMENNVKFLQAAP